MTIDYSALLTEDQKRSLLTQRINQFAQEAFQHDLNLKLATATSNTELANASNTALTNLDAAIKVNQDALAELPADVVVSQ